MAGRVKARQFAQHHDALPRGQGQFTRRTDRLTKATLDAAIDQGIDPRHGLEVLDVDLGVLVQDHAGVEQPRGVEQGLDAVHQPIRLAAPFELHIGRDVAAGAVLRLERTVVLFDHQVTQLVHESAVTAHLGRIAQVRRDDEVQVPLQRMTEDDGVVIAMDREQALQVDGTLGQPVERKGNVLDDHRSPRGTHRADRGKHTLADLPQALEFFRDIGEADLTEPGHRFQGLPDAADVGVQPGLIR